MRATVFNSCARWPLCYVIARFTGSGWLASVFPDEFGETEPIYRSVVEYATEIDAERAMALEWQTVGVFTKPLPEGAA